MTVFRGAMVELPVIKAFTHEGRVFNIGETITVAPVVAAVLHHKGVVSATKGYKAKVVAPEPEPDKPRRRRTYRRRDMTAEKP